MSRYDGERTPLGQRIKAAREAKGLTQDQLAEALQTRRHVIIRWEKGEHVPQRRHQRRLAEILELPLDEFEPDPEDEQLLASLASQVNAFAKEEAA